MIMADLLDSGQARGHQFTITAVRPGGRMEFDPAADLDFLADVFNYPATVKSLGAWRSLPDSLFRKILARKRFVHLSNAYVDICNLPYLPCSGASQPSCPHKSNRQLVRNFVARDFGKACFACKPVVRRLFAESRLNLFLSPLHRDTCQKVIGLDSAHPAFVLKPTVDGKLFFNRGMERDIDYLFVGVIGEAKGLEELRRNFWDKDIHFAGKLYPGTKLGFGTYHGAVPYEEVPLLMNRARHFVFLPRWPEPQGRVVIEAALCGCKLVTNDHVGATSFPFDISNIDNFRNATEEFWTTIEHLQ